MVRKHGKTRALKVAQKSEVQPGSEGEGEGRKNGGSWRKVKLGTIRNNGASGRRDAEDSLKDQASSTHEEWRSTLKDKETGTVSQREKNHRRRDSQKKGLTGKRIKKSFFGNERTNFPSRGKGGGSLAPVSR